MTAILLGLRDSRAMTVRELRRTVRSVDSLLTALILPAMILTLFVFVFGGAIQTGTDYVNYVVPGIILLCAGFGAASTAISVAQDMETGIIGRFRTMPIFRSSVLAGHVTASVARNLVASAIVVGLSIAYGFRPTASPIGWLLAIGLLVLFILAFTWVACAVGLVASPDAANGLTFVLLFLPYVSSGFVPTDTMPTVLHAFAEHQPLTPIIETMRALLTDAPVGTNGVVAVAWCLGILAVGYTMASLAFARSD